MTRLLFWAVVLGVGWLMVSGTVPIPGIADDEVVFATPPPVVTCGPSGCLGVYTLDLANVGRTEQGSVKVRLRADTLGTPAVSPTLRRLGEVTAVQATSERSSVDAYMLGRLEPDEQASLVFALHAPTREATPGWERLLVGVEPAHGAARPGEPGAITTGRLVHATARFVMRVVDGVRAAVKS